MASSFWFDTINLESQLYIIEVYIYIYFLFKDLFYHNKVNSVAPDEMPQSYYAAFHLGLHCLQKYLFKGRFLYTKG